MLDGADGLAERLRGRPSEHLNEAFDELFDDLLKRRVDQPRRRPRRHRGAGRGDHALPHDHRGGPGPHRPALHHRLQHRAGDAAGIRRGLRERGARRAPPHRLRRPLPHRHGAPRTTATARRSSACWPSRCRSPTRCSTRRGRRTTRTGSSSAVSSEETHAFAAQCLTRRLKVIGLALTRRLDELAIRGRGQPDRADQARSSSDRRSDFPSDRRTDRL